MEQVADILELKFEGNGINPDAVRPHEVAELIIGFEKALLFAIKDQHPEIDTEELLFTFDSIHNESLDLRFIPKRVRDIILSSYLSISASISSGDFTNLNNDTIKSLRTFTKFAKKYNCIGYLKHNDETLSTITPNTEIASNKNRVIKEETTIFGKLIDAGGENPNIHFKINDDYILIFNTTESNAKKLGSKLYQKIALSGTAKWDSKTFELLDFKLNDIVDYTPGNTLQAINELKGITSGYWDKFNTNDEINNQLLRD